MQNEMLLEPEQLEIVFDSLDADGNGYLTFDEFIQGFGNVAQNFVKIYLYFPVVEIMCFLSWLEWKAFTWKTIHPKLRPFKI